MYDPLEDSAVIAKKLTPGAKVALMGMTSEFQFPGRMTFTANGAHALVWAKLGLGQAYLAESQVQQVRPTAKAKRRAYRLTPAGEIVQAYIRRTDRRFTT